MRAAAAPTARTPKRQYACLPWRRSKRGVEILLVTTLTTRRWIIPKGWPVANCTPNECAAYEALEEAGVIGTVATRVLGSFRYDKLRKSGIVIPCKVDVVPMEVVTQRRKWAERGRRELRWCTCDEAIELIGDVGLQRLIAKFARLAAAPTVS